MTADNQLRPEDVGMKSTESYITPDQKLLQTAYALIAGSLATFGHVEFPGLREIIFGSKNAPPETDFPHGKPPELP